ncbi:Cell division inhibitor [Arcticibacter svalbardensis MN12-7]|uniref:Cell division inhibitor n=1 Tax=Arcticibacter svalbardensis MN12-7 TaxID=1150600 RepID=R9GW94_9SPHI|nr:TIGR01777 family oxidoreductase [Arcticibacter svalbardensis]EOR93179.1 Cell division inhibitor [Arcticibacter svalbardensis MN12-7]
MSATVLITGASGLIGKPLIKLILNQGYQIHVLSRKEPQYNPSFKEFKWDVKTGYIDKNCMANVDTIIHLAGEGIAEKPWRKERKQAIISSRVDSLGLIFKALKDNPQCQVKSLISASAVGYYGDRNDKFLDENSDPGEGFLSEACVLWEKAADMGLDLNMRVVKLRTGVVLSLQGGALPQIAGPVKYNLGTVLGSGKQWIPWIHIDDMVNAYLFALQNNSMTGTYNLCAPNPVTNKEFTKSISTVLNKTLWLPNVPALALRIFLGEMKAVVLSSTRTRSDKIRETGFKFKFEHIKEALKELYAK